MKKVFDNKSFVEIKIGSPGKIAIILAAQDKDNKLKMQINACEINISEFAEMINSLEVNIPIKNKVVESV